MKKTMNLLIIGLGIVMLSFFTISCGDADEVSLDETTVENFVDRSVFGLQSIGKIGKMGCYEFIFPVDIVMPDGNAVSIDDYEGLRAAITDFIENAQDTSATKPMLIYPVDLTNDEGEIIAVASAEEMKELRAECRKEFFDNVRNRRHSNGDICFTIAYPIEISFPDGSIVSAEDKLSLKSTIRAWKAENPDAEESPELVFPLTVEFNDGSTATLESKEGFTRVREACSQN